MTPYRIESKHGFKGELKVAYISIEARQTSLRETNFVRADRTNCAGQEFEGGV